MLSATRRGVPPPDGRVVAVLLDEGSEAAAFHKLLEAMARHRVIVTVVTARRHAVSLSDGESLLADAVLPGSADVAFDALALILTPEAADTLADDPHVLAFVHGAFLGLKAIAHDLGAAVLLDRCGIEGDAFVLPVDCTADLLACLPGRCLTRAVRLTRSA